MKRLICLTACLLLQHDGSDLGPVSVSDDKEIALVQKIIELLARLFDIGQLLLVSSFLAASEQGVTPESDHCDPFHFISYLFDFLSGRAGYFTKIKLNYYFCDLRRNNPGIFASLSV